MSKTITIQPGQPGEGMDYNVHKPLPYPFHIDASTGDCVHGRGTDAIASDVAPGGDPWLLIGFGFQQDRSRQQVDLWFTDFVDLPEDAIGMYPVFIHAGEIFSLDVPITNVRVIGQAESA